MVIWMGPWKGIIGIPRAALELGLWPGWWQIGAPKLHYSQNLTPKHHNRFPKFKTFMWFGSILSLASVTRSSLSFRFSLLSQRPNRRLRREEREMGGLTSAVIAIAGVVLGWITIEIACKPCLEQGRQAIDRSLNPDYDPDDDQNVDIRAPLNPSSSLPQDSDPNAHTASSAPKVITISWSPFSLFRYDFFPVALFVWFFCLISRCIFSWKSNEKVRKERWCVFSWLS